MAERVREVENRGTEQLRENERKKERKRAVRNNWVVFRVLELGFSKITILPFEMSKLT